MKTGSEPCAHCNGLRHALADKEQELHALRNRIEELTQHDALTGALNRRNIIEMLESELSRARRTGHPFCFAIIDLDHFRQVNEQHGHPAGDRVLKTVSETAITLLRAIDRFGRLGGEEFGIVLPATWLDQGVIAMNRLTKAVAECNWAEIAPGLAITFSAGITTNALGDTADTMIQRAEQALSEAKQAGRSRIVQIEEPLPDMPPMDDD